MSSPLIRALKGEKIWPPPVWLMRQAGRFLPSYRALREKYSFSELYKTPELAAKVTLLPVEELKVDGAILFSDILVIPEAMGLPLQFSEKEGPQFLSFIQSEKDLKKLHPFSPKDQLPFVGQTIQILLSKLPKEVTLIGFSGAPWTLAVYMVGGKQKNFFPIKQFAYQQVSWLFQLLEILTDAVANYLQYQIQQGAQVVQIFDTWAGLLDEEGFLQWVLPYVKQVLKNLPQQVPVIYFSKGTTAWLSHLQHLSCPLSIDWTLSPRKIREFFPYRPLQGNLDPAVLLTEPEVIRKKTREMLRQFGPPLVANLGHGILPQTPVENAKAFVQTVREGKDLS